MLGASKKVAESRLLIRDLEHEKLRREHAEELAEFLQMECNFRCCKCTRVSTTGHETLQALDDKLATGLQRIRDGMQEVLASATQRDEEVMDVDEKPGMNTSSAPVANGCDTPMEEPSPKPEAHRLNVGPSKEDELDRSMTMTAESPRAISPTTQVVQQEVAALPSPGALEGPTTDEATETTATIPIRPSTPPAASSQNHHTTPYHHQHSIRTVTTTTTVPMHFTPVSKPHLIPNNSTIDAENIPPTQTTDLAAPTFDRAAALAAIEYRRGRAKSLANGTATPRKQMIEGTMGGRRDISAPALGQKSANAGAGGSFVKGAASVGRATGRKMV